MTEEDINKIKGDFRLFLWLVWQHINLPEPTPLQYDIARYMQGGPNKIVIEAFRGVGKSFVAAAFVLWCLLNDPQIKVFVVSASKTRADAFTTFCLRLIEEMEILEHLKPKENQRQSRIEFDVGPATADQSPSMRSVGITGQITGSRADLIIADDVEVLNNSATADMREKLLERTKEFSAILKPLPTSRVIYLGTPQTEDSIYNKLPETFETRIWPALVPTEKQVEQYGVKLAPFVQHMIKQGKPPGTPTDPRRFTREDLSDRESEYGRAGFMLQFMLNTTLSDMERYPLKIRDLIVCDVAPERGPMSLEWMPELDSELKKLPNLAMTGDRFYAPRSVSGTFSEWKGCVMSIDPSGRGKDETGYAIVKMLNGYLHVKKAGGLMGGYDLPVLTKLAEMAKAEGVSEVVVEGNYGGGMFTELLKPVLASIHPCRVEEVTSKGQKERRIIDTLEPVMNRHKLILDKQVIEDDYRTAQAYDGENKFAKTLIYQMTRISYEKGSLKHDDRLDALAIAVGYWVERMGQDDKKGIQMEKDRLLDLELKSFLTRVQTPTRISVTSFPGGNTTKKGVFSPITGRRSK